MNRSPSASFLGLAAALFVLATACGEPDPRQLLVEMRDALREVETVRYSVRFRGSGDQAAQWPSHVGSVVIRRLDLSGGRFLAVLDTEIERPDGSSDHVVGARSEDEVILLSASDRSARRSSIYEAGSSLLAWMEPTLMYVFYDPESLEDEIGADSVVWEGRGEVAGEPCGLVRVGWQDEEEDGRWCIGRDRLPRRLEWIQGGGATVLEASQLEVDPATPEALFAPPVPDGYSVEELAYGPEAGVAAPNDPMRSAGGELVGLPDLEGEVLVLDFWATWCPPCLTSLASLDVLIEDFEGRPVRFLAVNSMEDPSAEPEAFFRQRGFSSELLLGGDPVHSFYVLGSLPGTAVLDASGRLVGVSIGYHGEGSERRLASLIEQALEAPAAP